MGTGFKRKKIPRELILGPPPRKPRWWLWLSLAFGFTAAALFAMSTIAKPLEAGTGELLFKTDDGDMEAALHLGSNYETVVTGIVANTTLTQSFENTSQDWREAVYIFPLPETAAVHAMQLRIGERLITAEIQEREQATKTYAAARAAGKVAALTEQERPNLFTQSVANTAPGATIEVTIRFIQVIDYKDGGFTLRLPLTLTPRYIPGRPVDFEIAHRLTSTGRAMPTNQVADAHRITPFMTNRPKKGSHYAKVSVSLKPGLALASIAGPYHEILTRQDGDTHTVSLRDGEVAMDRDFVLEWRPTADPRPRAAFFGEHADGSDYGLLLLMPPTIDEVIPLAREITFIIDTSGSMKGVSIRQARLALKDALNHLRAGDRFNIVAFNSDYHTLLPEPQQVNAVTLDLGERFVDRLSADGGTEMRAPLEAALSEPASTEVESFPARLPALYASEPLIVLARGSVLQGDAVVTGASKYLNWRESVAVEQFISRLPGDPLERQAVPNRVAKGQQVAAITMPRTSTHSMLALVMGLVALVLAAWIRWRGARACV